MFQLNIELNIELCANRPVHKEATTKWKIVGNFFEIHENEEKEYALIFDCRKQKFLTQMCNIYYFKLYLTAKFTFF